MKKLAVFLLLVPAVLLCAGCSGPHPAKRQKSDNSDISDIKDTVIKYDHLLAEGYWNRNMDGLGAVATPKRAQQVYYHMAALGEEKIRMDSKLDSIDFTEAKILPSGEAEVQTDEIWDFRHMNTDTGKIVLNKTADYHMEYSLVKKSGRWFVSGATVVGDGKQK